jgi:hypothetical protein
VGAALAAKDGRMGWEEFFRYRTITTYNIW